MSTKNIGTVVQVTGPVLDIPFPEASLPNLLNAITLEHNGKTITAEVEQQIGGGVVRCVAMSSTDGLIRGLDVLDTGHPIMMPVSTKADPSMNICMEIGMPMVSSALIRFHAKFPHRKKVKYRLNEAFLRK